MEQQESGQALQENTSSLAIKKAEKRWMSDPQPHTWPGLGKALIPPPRLYAHVHTHAFAVNTYTKSPCRTLCPEH